MCGRPGRPVPLIDLSQPEDQSFPCRRRPDRERRLDRLAVAVLTALGERDGAVSDAERRAGEALQTMTIDGVCRCARRSSGAAGHPATPTRTRPARQRRPISARRIQRLGHSLSHHRGHPVGVAARRSASARRPGPWGDDAFTCRAAMDNAPGRWRWPNRRCVHG